MVAGAHVEEVADPAGDGVRRLRTNDMEVGIAEAVRRQVQRHVATPKPVSQRRLDFEHARPRWAREMAAEAIGVFIYVYAGIGSQASLFLNGSQPVFGSLFQIGWAYGLGIAFAIIVVGSTSGGHLNPGVTICFALWLGFPWSKVPRYIFAQIVGSFVAGLLLVAQYYPEMMALAAEYRAKGLSPNSSGGPGSALCSFPGPTQTNYGFVFVNEFFVDSFFAIVTWAVLDPANPFVSPQTAPFIIGLTIGLMIWSYASVTVEINSARDLGTRFVAAIFFGSDAFSRYSPIAILTNIPAYIFGTTVYEVFLRDSFAIIAHGHNIHEDGEEGLARHLVRVGTADQIGNSSSRGQSKEGSDRSERKEISPV